MAGGRRGDPEAEELIIAALERQNTPAIVKATLCELLGQYSSDEAAHALDNATQSQNSLVREAAVFSRPIQSVEQVQKTVIPALADPVPRQIEKLTEHYGFDLPP